MKKIEITTLLLLLKKLARYDADFYHNIGMNKYPGGQYYKIEDVEKLLKDLQ